jgi:hypothetical protein
MRARDGSRQEKLAGDDSTLSNAVKESKRYLENFTCFSPLTKWRLIGDFDGWR